MNDIPEGFRLSTALSTAASNTAIIAGSILQSPTNDSTVKLYVVDNLGAVREQPSIISGFYKKLIVAIFVVAAGCLLIEVSLGFAWPSPTVAQQNVINAVDFGWKTGLGFIIGLFTGKQLR